MYTRFLPTPTHSILLFGPRGTGKSTWIRDRFPDAVTYDLLDTGEALRLSKDPHTLYRELATLSSGNWAVIDEVQKVPELLDEVHRLIETLRLRFVLSGSSARKLRRGGANLLAGRAITTSMFPLVSAELPFEINPERALRFGMLPMAVTTDTPQDYLRTYAETYLVQEIQAEALTRNLGAFARFLEIAARRNGQVTNAAGIARDAGINRRTVQNHFEILTDTLVGFWLPPWKLKSATKQVRQSKFYFFDCGVARALTVGLPIRLHPKNWALLPKPSSSTNCAHTSAIRPRTTSCVSGAATTAWRSTYCVKRWKVSLRSRSRRHRDGTGASTAACTGSGTTSGKTERHAMECTLANERLFGTMSECCPWSIFSSACGPVRFLVPSDDRPRIRAGAPDSSRSGPVQLRQRPAEGPPPALEAVQRRRDRRHRLGG